MNHWTIGKRITVGFAAVLAVFLGFATIVWIQNQRLGNAVEVITTDNLPGIRYTAQLLEETLEYRALTLQHVIATDASEMTALDKAADDKADQILKTVDEYRKSVSRADEIVLADRIVPALTQYRELAKEMRKLSMAGKTQEAAAMIKPVGEAFFAYEKTVSDCKDDNLKWSDQSTGVVKSALASSVRFTIISVILGLVIGVVLAIVIARSVGRALSRIATMLEDGSNQVAAAAGQVSAASQTLAEGASEQAASLEETSSSLEEMASMTRRNAENAEKANHLARQARTAADVGAGDMETMNAAMEAIKNSSDDIAKIIKTIDEIAFQTNILALNAAVEAARAGEAGMGFAVVADEVRSLAQRCAQSAKETSAKIESAITKSAQGVEISTKVTQGLQEIVKSARQVDELVSEVTSASKEQSQGVSQVNAAVGQMDKVTQSNAASAEESASAAEELNAQAQSLKDAVIDLLSLVGGAGKSAGAVGAVSSPRQKPVQSVTAPAVHSNGAANGVKPARAVTPLAMATDRKRDLIPLEGDFKDM